MECFGHIATQSGHENLRPLRREFRGSSRPPWTVASSDPAARYYDLKAEPERIRTCLEDFTPWAEWPAIETFYRLLEWVNAEDSLFESNDCAFNGPSPNYTAEFPKALEVTGRLMILFREIPLNLSLENIEWLTAALHQHLAESDPTLAHGVVGITVVPTRYVAVAIAADRQVGFQVMLSFWSWGDAIDEVMENLRRCKVSRTPFDWCKRRRGTLSRSGITDGRRRPRSR